MRGAVGIRIRTDQKNNYTLHREEPVQAHGTEDLVKIFDGAAMVTRYQKLGLMIVGLWAAMGKWQLSIKWPAG